MKMIRLAAVVVAIAAAGCETLEKEFLDPFRDKITWGLPKVTTPLPEGAAIYLERPIGAATKGVYARNGMSIVKAFENEFKRRGAKPVVGEKAIEDFDKTMENAQKAQCKYALLIDIVKWEYSDVGWSGKGNRDEVLFDVMLVNAERRRVMSRAQVEVTNGVLRSAPGGNDTDDAVAPVIKRYVNKLYNP